MASNVVTKVVSQLQQFGQTRRGWLGVRIQDVDADLAESLGLEKVAGALVTDVPDGPAKDGGLLQGDVILSFDGVEVADTRALVRKVGESEVGAVARLVVFRDGKTETLKVTLGRREEAEAATPAAAPLDEAPAEASTLGMTVASLTPDLRRELSLADDATGLAVRAVEETSEAFERGMRPGDLIAEAGQVTIETPSDLTDAIEQAKDAGRKSVLLLVRRGGEPRFVALSIE
jgi:serine protease Do